MQFTQPAYDQNAYAGRRPGGSGVPTSKILFQIIAEFVEKCQAYEYKTDTCKNSTKMNNVSNNNRKVRISKLKKKLKSDVIVIFLIFLGS